MANAVGGHLHILVDGGTMYRIPELSDRARLTVIDPDNEVYLSAASAWEIAIKHVTKASASSPYQINQDNLFRPSEHCLDWQPSPSKRKQCWPWPVFRRMVARSRSTDS